MNAEAEAEEASVADVRVAREEAEPASDPEAVKETGATMTSLEAELEMATTVLADDVSTTAAAVVGFRMYTGTVLVASAHGCVVHG